MYGKKILNQLTAYKQGKQTSEVKREFKLDKIVKLSSNENPYGYSNKIKEALKKTELPFEIYPDGYAYDLRKKLAEKLAVKESEIVFSNGSEELITLICRAFLYPGVNTVMATPTFPLYRHQSLIEGAEVKEVPTIEGRHDLAQMLAAIDAETKVIWICSPDNPSGTLVSKGEFEQFMEQCPEDVLVVLDEAYYEYVDDNLKLNAAENIKKYKNLIVLRTFSKAYGLAGLRVGYSIVNEPIANKLNVVRGAFNTSAFAQKVALTALDDHAFIAETKRLNDEVKHNFQHYLETLGWPYFESYTNFLLVETPIHADKAAHYLLTKGYIVRSGEALGYPNTIRITLGNKSDMLELQNILKQMQLEIKNGELG